jgi:cobalt/nickel transport protein
MMTIVAVGARSKNRRREDEMHRTIWPLLALTGLVLTIHTAAAHYNMLLPQTASAKRGEAVTLVYQWGHPFEHQLFDAPVPEKVIVRAPDGKTSDQTPEPLTVQVGDKKVWAYRLRFTPEQRGDFVWVLQTPPIWMEEEEQFFRDTVKVVLHVQAQTGWDAAAGQDFEWVPLTRPYGLRPGMVFQAQVLTNGKPLPATLVEIEHYNPTPPKELPPDEQITHTARTDPNGVVTATLTEPGWWCLTAQRDGGQKEHNGKSYPVRQRTTLWVFVDDKPAPKLAP